MSSDALKIRSLFIIVEIFFVDFDIQSPPIEHPLLLFRASLLDENLNFQIPKKYVSLLKKTKG